MALPKSIFVPCWPIPLLSLDVSTLISKACPEQLPKFSRKYYDDDIAVRIKVNVDNLATSFFVNLSEIKQKFGEPGLCK